MKYRALVLVTSLIILSTAIFVGERVLSLVAKKAQIIGASSAIASAMQAEVRKPDSKVRVLVSEMLVTNETVELDANQYDVMVDFLVSKKYQLDAPPPWKPGMALVDPWGKRFRIIIQQTASDPSPTVTVTNHPR